MSLENLLLLENLASHIVNALSLLGVQLLKLHRRVVFDLMLILVQKINFRSLRPDPVG